MTKTHDLIDLQLILQKGAVDLNKIRDVCHRLFYYRRTHAWPPVMVKGENWDAVYQNQKGVLPVIPTVDEAVEWANELIVKIEGAGAHLERMFPKHNEGIVK